MKTLLNGDTPQYRSYPTGPYKCDKCDRSFPTEQGRTVHRSRMHKMTDPTETAKEARTTRTRRAPTPEKPEVAGPTFCPCCGTNLRVIALAMNFKPAP